MNDRVRHSLLPPGELWRWVRENAVAAFTIAGLFLYGSLRLAAGIFYGRLGVSPEEVGFGYAEMIARSIYGLALLVIIMLLVRFVVMPSLLAIGYFGYRLIRPAADTSRVAGLRTGFIHGFRRGVRMSVDDWVFDVVGLAVVLLPIMLATFAGIDAANGIPSDPAFTGVSWRAEAARIYPDVPSEPIEEGKCVLYLGQNQGVTVLYEPKSRTTWRVPTSGAVVETGGALDDVERVPEDC
jgi:hypothetical protein